MDTFAAFAMGAANRGKPLMVFDWKKAAEIIRKEMPREAEAGLEGDWQFTGGLIFRDGKIVDDCYTYLASTWARPQILIDGAYRDCFVMEGETEWNESTKWPAEAKAILSA